MDLLDYVEGQRRRDAGMDQAVGNAEQKKPGWPEKALAFIEMQPIGKVFMVEDIRVYACSRGLPRPPSNRAWGGVIKKARQLGLVKHIGYAPVKNPAAHAGMASQWQRVTPE